MSYKALCARTWDEMAAKYHRRWSSDRRGPWGGATAATVECARIKRGDSVLDVACGTGMSSAALAKAAGPSGFVLGVDASRAALRIARGAAPGCAFACMDAERLGSARAFDAAVCQYALFFFPDACGALRQMSACLRKGGRITVTVHGNDTPYYTSILDAVERYVPGYLPAGSPRLDRFGSRPALASELRGAGLSSVRVREFRFSYSPGTFEQYWSAYRRYASGRVRSMLAKLSRPEMAGLKRQARENAARYAGRGGRITFPWQVLVGSARASKGL